MSKPKARKPRAAPKKPAQEVESIELATFIPESERIGLDKSWKTLSPCPFVNIERATIWGHNQVKRGICDAVVVCQEAPGFWHVFGRRAQHA